jgi:hypothetical protein
VLELAGTVKAAGLQPAIHLFAKDKMLSAEKVDWSYWSAGQAADSSATPVLKAFIQRAHQADIPLWLYDY